MAVRQDLSISAAVAESFPDFDREERRAGTLLIGALGCGTSYASLRAFTGVPWASVNKAGYWFRRGGIWRGQTMNYPWLEPYLDGDPIGEVGFIVDVQVGIGMVDRTVIDGEPHYRQATLVDGEFSRYEFFRLHPPHRQQQRAAA